MLQTWQSLTFIHWRYDPAVIRPLIPERLTLDTFDDAAWIGLTPFLLTGLRLPSLPALPWISCFPETNVRTYVRGPNGDRAIWFFTLEADRLLAVLGARLSYGLPYRWADMRVNVNGSTVSYQSRRRASLRSAYSAIDVEIGQPIEQSQLEIFLTSRYRLYSQYGKRLAYAQIEHEPWPLHAAVILRLDQTVVEGSGLPRPEGEPLAHHSPNLEVRIERLRFQSP